MNKPTDLRLLLSLLTVSQLQEYDALLAHIPSPTLRDKCQLAAWILTGTTGVENILREIQNEKGSAWSSSQEDNG